MAEIWTGLLGNLGCIAILLAFWNRIVDRVDRWPASYRSLIFGIFCGIGAVIMMRLLPIRISDGVLIDLRIVLVTVAGFFGGWPAAIVAATIGFLYRLSEGGIGTFAGCMTFVVGAFVGLSVRQSRHIIANRYIAMALLSAATAAGALACLMLLPEAVWRQVVPVVWQPGILLVVSATFISCLIIDQDGRRREAIRVNGIYRSIFELLPDGLSAKDLEGRFLVANPATVQLLRAKSSDALFGRREVDFFPPDAAAKLQDSEAEMLAAGTPRMMEQQLNFPDGRSVMLSTLRAPLRNEDSETIGVISLTRDVTSERALETQLRIAEQRLSVALQEMADGLVLFDANFRITFSNEQYRSLFPLTADLRVPGRHIDEILKAAVARGEEPVSIDRVDEWIEEVRRCFNSNETQHFRLADGRWMESRSRVIADGGYLVLITDVTATRESEAALRNLNEQLNRLARTDGLTGVLNRRGFETLADEEWQAALAADEPFGMLLVDIDRFKAINDLNGHLEGDTCLKAVAEAIAEVIGEAGGSVGRYGGEEFAAIVRGISLRDLEDLSERVRLGVRDLAHPHPVSRDGIVTVSAGYAICQPSEGFTMLDLVRASDRALYLAKAAGRDCVRSEAVRRRAERRPRALSDRMESSGR